MSASRSATFLSRFQPIRNRVRNLILLLPKVFVNPNPGKTKVCCFHLNNRNAARTLKVQWEGKELENTPYPPYLGVTLDMTLWFKSHVDKLRKKISPRNNLIGILANSSWGADPHTLRTTSLVVLFRDSLLRRPENGPGTQAGKERVMYYLQAHTRNDAIFFPKLGEKTIFGKRFLIGA